MLWRIGYQFIALYVMSLLILWWLFSLWCSLSIKEFLSFILQQRRVVWVTDFVSILLPFSFVATIDGVGFGWYPASAHAQLKDPHPFEYWLSAFWRPSMARFAAEAVPRFGGLWSIRHFFHLVVSFSACPASRVWIHYAPSWEPFGEWRSVWVPK